MRTTASLLGAAMLFAACADPVPSPITAPTGAPLAAVVVAPCVGCAYGVVRFDRILGGRFEQATFSADAAASWVLVVTDNGNARTGAEVLINGVQHVAKVALEGAPTEVRIPVTLQTSNTMLVRVFGDLGANVRVSIEPGTVATLTITPGVAERLPNGTLQFSVTGGPSGPYTWSVNGVDGGNSTFGTVSATGFYTAPGAVPTPSSFQLCARVTATPAVRGCVTVTINPIPTAGADVVVFNDINLFDGGAMSDINNKRMVRNLVNFTGTGPRSLGTEVVMEGGHGSGTPQCFDVPARTEIIGAGFTITSRTSSVIGAQAPGVKVLILCLPLTAYSRTEINNMKQFSAEGGRIIFVGEHSAFYGSGIPIENQFLIDMGAVMRNIGDFVDCGYNVQPASSLRSHQVTTGMTQVTMACASVITLGPNDFALFYDRTNTRVLAGVAKVDVTPLPLVAADFTPSLSVSPSRAVRTRPTHDAIGNRLR